VSILLVNIGNHYNRHRLQASNISGVRLNYWQINLTIPETLFFTVSLHRRHKLQKLQAASLKATGCKLQKLQLTLQTKLLQGSRHRI